MTGVISGSKLWISTEEELSITYLKVETSVSHLSAAPWQMWCHCYCFFQTDNYQTKSALVSQLSWRIQQSFHEAALTHSSTCTLSESGFKKYCGWPEKRKPNLQNQARGWENRDQTLRRVKRLQESEPFLPSARIWKKKKTQPQQAFMTVTSCLLEIQISALKMSVGSGLWQSLDNFERQLPCPVHPFLTSNGLVLLRVLISLQGTELPGYQVYFFPDW